MFLVNVSRFSIELCDTCTIVMPCMHTLPSACALHCQLERCLTVVKPPPKGSMVVSEGSMVEFVRQNAQVRIMQRGCGPFRHEAA